MLEGLYESTVRDLVGQHLEEAQSEEISAELGTGATLAAAAKTLGQDSDGSIRKSMVNAAREAMHEDEAKRVDYFARKVAAAKFAEQLMRNPNFGWFTPRTAIGCALDWVRRRIVTHDFENIDTRQFIEQLANTEAGDKLAAFGETKLRAVLRTVAYQFERYGEAASDYFARRAWAISVVVSIILAFVVNVDAVRTFKTRVVNPAISEKVRQSFEALQAAQAKTDAAHAKPTEPPQAGGQRTRGKRKRKTVSLQQTPTRTWRRLLSRQERLLPGSTSRESRSAGTTSRSARRTSPTRNFAPTRASLRRGTTISETLGAGFWCRSIGLPISRIG
jgi:hypothetical protein